MIIHSPILGIVNFDSCEARDSSARVSVGRSMLVTIVQFPDPDAQVRDAMVMLCEPDR